MEEMKHSHEHHHECHCENSHEHHHEHHHECSCGTEEHEHQGCGCHHHHHEEGGLKSKLILIGVTVILLITAVFIEKEYSLATWQLLLVYLIPYLLIGHETLGEAAEGIAKGDMFNENFLMAIATIGALCIGFFPGSDTEFPEAVFVMLFFQVGELFEGYAEGKSRDSISHLMNIRPDVANVERNGKIEAVSPEDVKIGETIVIRPGEKVPLDGIVVEGNSALNTIALAVIPPFLAATRIVGEGTFGENFPLWLNRALIFLVVSCPCALIISVPLTFFGGIGGASRNGILIKGSNYMDALAKVGTVVFDKTGTLTHGEFAVAAVHADASCPDHPSHDTDNVHIGEYSDKEKILLHLAAHAEHFTTHPIGAALRTAFPQEATDGCEVTDVEEIAGQGIRAKVNGKVVCVGNKKMMESIGAQWHDCNQVGTIIHIAIDGKYAGHIVINDTLKEGSAHAIRELKELGVEKTVMLTGDRREVGEDVAHKLGLDECRAELLPTDKVSHVEQLLKTKPAGKTLAYVGDGINDAPVLKRADVGIAMGGLGSDAAIEAADVVLMDDDPRKIALAVKIARRTIHIAHENVVFAIGVKVAVLILATIGLGTMWMAVFADVGVTVLAVLNAMRSLGKNRLFYR